MSNLAIQNVDVLEIPESEPVRVRKSCRIMVRDGKIDAVESMANPISDNTVPILDGKGRLAMPGLINAHAHVPMVIFRGLAEDVSLEKWFNEYMWPLESNLQEEDVYWGMMLGLVEMIEGGVTFVADHYFHMDRAAEAVEKAGIRALLGWAVFGNQGLSMLDRTCEFVSRWRHQAAGRIHTCLAPHAPYTCDDGFLRACADRAASMGAMIHIHAAETEEQTLLSAEKTGKTPIQILDETGILHYPAIIAHAVGATPDDIRLLSKRPAGIAHAPKTYLKLAMGIAPIRSFLNAGIPVGLATDGAVSNNTLDIWESLRLMAMTQKQDAGNPEVLDLNTALRIATRQSAQVVGMKGIIGAIEPGHQADIILISLEGAHHQPLHNVSASLVYATRASDVQDVIVDGNVIMRDRQLLTIDKQEIIREVAKSIGRLSKRVPGSRIQYYNP